MSANPIDAFCAGVPMITTDDARHGPEVSYLESGRNGFIVANNAQVYADTVLRLIEDPAELARVRDAAARDARRYTLDRMVENFLEGIEVEVNCFGGEHRAWLGHGPRSVNQPTIRRFTATSGNLVIVSENGQTYWARTR